MLVANEIKRLFQTPLPKDPVHRRKQKASKSSSLKLSKCGLKYLAAISMPFSPEAVGACVPQPSTAGSQKIYGFNRFDVVSTGQNIWINLIPCLANDGIISFVTTTTADNIILSANNTLATGVTAIAPGGLLFGGSDFITNAGVGASPVTGRVVSLGVRVTYIGTTMNQAGLVYCYQSPRHDNMSLLGSGNTGPLSLARLLQYRDVVTEPVSRDPCELNMFGTDEVERQFADQVYTNITSLVYPLSGGANALSGPTTTAFQYLAGGSNVGCPGGVVCISGMPTGQGVHVEIVQHIELSGLRVQANFTENTAHPDDIGKVNSIVARMPSIKADNPHIKPWELVKSAAAIVGRAAVEYALPVAEKALMSLIL